VNELAKNLTIKMDDIMYHDVEMAIKGLKKRKSPRYDRIHGEIIQAGRKNLHKKYTNCAMRHLYWYKESDPVSPSQFIAYLKE